MPKTPTSDYDHGHVCRYIYIFIVCIIINTNTIIYLHILQNDMLFECDILPSFWILLIHFSEFLHPQLVLENRY